MVLRNQPSTRVRYPAAIGEEGEREKRRGRRRVNEKKEKHF